MSLIVGSVLFMLPTTLWAQTDDTGNEGLLTSTSTTTTTTGLTTTGVVLTVYLVTPKKGRNAALKRYLEHNVVAVRHSIATGGGEGAIDLALFFGVESDHVGSFARLLRALHTDLTPTLSDSLITQKEVDRFVEIVYLAMTHHDLLARDAHRLDAHSS